jgi:hypothetical protein
MSATYSWLMPMSDELAAHKVGRGAFSFITLSGNTPCLSAAHPLDLVAAHQARNARNAYVTDQHISVS